MVIFLRLMLMSGLHSADKTCLTLFYHIRSTPWYTLKIVF